MSAVRVQRTWRMQNNTKIVCDGNEPTSCPDAIPVEGYNSVEARKNARERGWVVNLPHPRGQRRRFDYCPKHAHMVGE